MTRLFRSKSCTTARPTTNSFFFHASPPSPSLYLTNDDEEDDFEYDEDSLFDDGYFGNNRIRTPFISLDQRRQTQSAGNNNNFPLLTILVTALRKSIVTCSVDIDEDVASTTTSSMDIGCPTDVKHVSHVTFDRFNGFLGLPVELEPEVPRKVPSASVRVFGVSAESMQCTYDQRGNSVPTILLMMQKRLYSGGGLQAEGIFRINAENSQEEYVRNQLNEGFVPHGIDVHCLAGLIKAWFRELPTGVLDSLTPEQVMHCNSEDECTRLVKSLPPTEAALLDWAINLMADVVKHENENKMNARNIAMVFAPNMTQMADPLTALIHAVQVMNLLKTLIIKTLRERQDSYPATVQAATPNSDSPSETSYSIRSNKVDSSGQSQTMENNVLRSSTLCRLESESEEKFWSFQSRNIDVMEGEECVSGRSSPVSCKRGDLCVKNGLNDENGEVEGILDRLSLRKGVKKLCRHPVFQLSKTAKKGGGGGGGFIHTRGGGGEAWT